jgi:nucleosome assembly protein 1-like 1
MSNPESETNPEVVLPPPPPASSLQRATAGAAPTAVSPESTTAALGGLNLADEDDDEDDDDDDEDFYPDGADEDMPPAMIRRITYLMDMHETTKKSLDEQYQAERAALESKFQTKYQEVFEKRAKVIRGELDAEIDTKYVAEGNEIDEAAEAGEKIVGCPQFWLVACSQEATVAEMLSEEDCDALEYLADVKCDNFADGCGFTLSFHFSANPYFTETVLTKTYSIPNLLSEDDPMLDKVEGCKITWKEGKSLTHKEVTKKQRNNKGKKSGQIRTVVKQERVPSFFHFFEPPELKEDVDEEEAEAMEEEFDRDFEVAQAFRVQLVPNAIAYFTGEANEEEDGDYEDDDDEDDEGDDDDDDDEDEDGDEEEEGVEGEDGIPTFSGNNKGKKNKKKGGAAGGAPPVFPPGAAGNGENPECKQN